MGDRHSYGAVAARCALLLVGSSWLSCEQFFNPYIVNHRVDCVQVATACGADQTCNPGTHTCEPAQSCGAGQALCPAGQSCDQATAQCVYQPVPPVVSCPDSKFCWENPLPSGTSFTRAWGTGP